MGDESMTIRSKDGEVIRSTDKLKNEGVVPDHIKTIAKKSGSMLTKQSIEFINGKRKISMKDISKTMRKKLLLQALVHSRGIVQDACTAVGVCRSTFQNYMTGDPDFKAAAEMLQEVQLDFVESQFFRNIERGDIASAIFYLKTKGAKRGYTEKPMIDREGAELEQYSQQELDEQIKVLEGQIASSEGNAQKTIRE